MKTPKHHHPRRRLTTAFTLIEIVIVLTIISILAAGSIYMLKGQIDSAKETRVDSDIGAISIALQSYEGKALRLPTTEQGLAALVEKPTTQPVPDRWSSFLEDVPKDPWGQEYQYKIPPVRSKKRFDLYSVGADGEEGTEDDIGNWR